eukprot:m.10022 g.10022  ORF g.10022 m.10022 type:complete len:253 (-) comp6494_c0_seq1:198-956(-)
MSQQSTSTIFGEAGGMVDLSHLKASTQQHLKRVYFALSLCTAVGAATAALSVFFSSGNNNLFHFAPFLGLILLFLLRSSRVNSAQQPTDRWLYLLGFGATTGFGITPLVSLVVAGIDPMLPISAFVMTAIVFGSFTMAALKAPSFQYLALQGVLGASVIGLFVVGLMNMFMFIPFMFSVMLWGGLILFSLFVLYDTQRIIARHESGDMDFLTHAADLFVDFAAIFRRILIILAQNSNNNNRSKNSQGKNKRR